MPTVTVPTDVFMSVLVSLIVLAAWHLVATGQNVFRWLQTRSSRVRSRRWR
jgi:hypothetical protein